MDFSGFIGSIVKINCSDGKYYSGKILDEDKDFVELYDINGHKVFLRKSLILDIREVDK